MRRRKVLRYRSKVGVPPPGGPMGKKGYDRKGQKKVLKEALEEYLEQQ